MILRTYSELSRLDTFEDRFDYLKLKGFVGKDTFGHERYLNQRFYTSREWKLVRQHVIARDLGNDLGVEGYGIFDRVIIHHMNPILPDDLIHGNEDVLDPEFLITTGHNTHNGIHYGDSSMLRNKHEERTPGDTTLW